MSNNRFSRREFARRVAITSAASLIPASTLVTPSPAHAQFAPDGPKLPAESQAEADLRTQSVLAQYGPRLSDDQKVEIPRLSANIQRSIDTLRKFTTENGDDPAVYLKPLMEREKKPAPNPAAAHSSTTKPTPPAAAAPKN